MDPKVKLLLNGGGDQGFEDPALNEWHVLVSGHSKPAREGQMKTGHFESGIAHRAAIADLMRDETNST